MIARLTLTLLLLCSLSQAGTIIGRFETATGGAVNNASLTFSLSQSAIMPGTAVVVSQYTYCYTDAAGSLVGVPDLIVPPSVATSTSSGTLPAGTYYVKIAYLGMNGGEGLPSPERKVALGAQGSLIISPPVAITNASGYAVYISTSPGTEALQGAGVAWSNYTQSAALVAGRTPQVANSSSCSLMFSDELIPTGTYYTVQMLNAKGTRIAGFPQSWCLYGGAGGTVDISRGTPVGTCSTNGVYYPTPILATPLSGAGGTQSINGSLNLEGYSLFNALVNPTRMLLVDQGQCTMVAGTCAAQGLGSTYAAAPLCFLAWTGTGTLAGTLKVASSTTSVTPASSNAGDTAKVNWACFGN